MIQPATTSEKPAVFQQILHQMARIMERLLIVISMGLLLLLSLIIIVAVFARFSGASLYWYDEISAILLAWLTFYGAALCALKRQHMSFDGWLAKRALWIKTLCFAIGEIMSIGFFILMAWAGGYLLSIFGDERLSSLEFIPLWFTQSALPIGAVLFVIAQLCSLPQAWAKINPSHQMINDRSEQSGSSESLAQAPCK